VTAGAPQLISRSCTTGWLDWVWGDLWLADDALYRISRGMAATRAAARERRGRDSRSTVSAADTRDETTVDALASKLADDDKNRLIPLDAIATARLRQGMLNGRLSISLDDGTRIKLLWLKDDPAYAILAARLGPWLDHGSS